MPADFAPRRSLTSALRGFAQTARMEEPPQANESAFWDQVADWLLGSRAPDGRPMSQDEIDALPRHEQDDPKPH